MMMMWHGRFALRGFASSASTLDKRVLVVGGSGALGKAVVESFKQQSWSTLSADVSPNPDAATSITLPKNTTWKEQAFFLKSELKKSGVDADGLDAVVCTAGGWQGASSSGVLFATSARVWTHLPFSRLCHTGGGVDSEKIFDSVDAMLNVCLRPAITAAHVAASFLRKDGLLVLTGADSAIRPTPTMIGYGLAKDATHYLVKSLASGGLVGRTVVGILPAMIDTPSNR